ncbi:MAG: YtxH domain-containing protein [Anaerolineae bacterium]|jgi:gas vesicle protein
MKELGFFLLGAAVGAVAALMLAPSSGEELRAQIQSTAEKDVERLQAEWEKGMEKTNEQIAKLQADVKQALQREEAESPVQE